MKAPVRKEEEESGSLNTLDRFWTKVEIGDCWRWTATTSRGYGQFWDGTRVQSAHRFLWQQLVGPILEGKQLDHLCRNRACVNPDHLEPVTQSENTRRSPIPSGGLRNGNKAKTHCKRGHVFDDANTRIYQGHRYCLACQAMHNRNRNRRAA